MQAPCQPRKQGPAILARSLSWLQCSTDLRGRRRIRSVLYWSLAARKPANKNRNVCSVFMNKETKGERVEKFNVHYKEHEDGIWQPFFGNYSLTQAMHYAYRMLLHGEVEMKGYVREKVVAVMVLPCVGPEERIG